MDAIAFRHIFGADVEPRSKLAIITWPRWPAEAVTRSMEPEACSVNCDWYGCDLATFLGCNGEVASAPSPITPADVYAFSGDRLTNTPGALPVNVWNAFDLFGDGIPAQILRLIVCSVNSYDRLNCHYKTTKSVENQLQH